jgi:hypothetical protein
MTIQSESNIDIDAVNTIDIDTLGLIDITSTLSNIDINTPAGIIELN